MIPYRVRAYLPAVAWAAVLFWIGGRSEVPGPTIEGGDKVAHFAAYGILGLLAGFGWCRVGRWPSRIWPLLFAMLLGGSDELRQRQIEMRSADAGDWVADVAGFALAFWATTSRCARSGRNGRIEG